MLVALKSLHCHSVSCWLALTKLKANRALGPFVKSPENVSGLKGPLLEERQTGDRHFDVSWPIVGHLSSVVTDDRLEALFFNIIQHPKDPNG